jgi:hypothetical protein
LCQAEIPGFQGFKRECEVFGHLERARAAMNCIGFG